MPEHLTTTRPKARKAHRCDLCTGTIRPGELPDPVRLRLRVLRGAWSS